MRMHVRLAYAAFIAATIAAAQAAGASVPTMNECLEASDFVANAARSRDNGVEREAFVARLQDDFVAIRAFPPALRWFVQDEDDEQFLASAAEAVYDSPRSPERHREIFLRACLDRLVAGAPADAQRRINTQDPDTI